MTSPFRGRSPAPGRFKAARRNSIRRPAGLFCALAVFVTLGQRVPRAAEDHQRPAALHVVGYLPEYRADSFDPFVAKQLTDLILFSAEPRADGSLDAHRLTPRVLTILQSVKRLRTTRVLVALGGWGRSQGFAPVALNAELRARFARNLVEFCVANRLDGIDFDWEHPASPAEDKAYGQLLASVKHAFQPHRLLLTVALASWQNPGPLAYQSVDRIHIMAYDHPDPRHATFELAKADVERFVARGVPKEKLCLGLPFFGRDMNNHNVEVSYAELAGRMPDPGRDELDGVYFNGAKTIQKKTRYASREGLGGVMVWELGQDAAGAASLLHAIHAALPPEPETQPGR